MQDFTMKPLGVGGIIDRAFRIYRANFGAMILLSLVIGGAADLVVGLLELGNHAFRTDSPIGALVSGGSFLAALDGVPSGEATILSTVLSWASNLFVTPLVAGGITFITMAVCHGENDTGSSYLSRMKPLYWKLVGTAFGIGVMTILMYIVVFIVAFIIAFIIPSYWFVFIACLFPILLITTVMSVAYPVAIHESRYGFSWFARAWELVCARFWKSLGVCIVASIIVGVLAFALALVSYMFPPLVSTVLDVLITGMLQPIMYISIALLYLDIRITKEAYDLELRAGAMDQAVIQPDQGGNNLNG